jgi:hypothetical protein
MKKAGLSGRISGAFLQKSLQMNNFPFSNLTKFEFLKTDPRTRIRVKISQVRNMEFHIPENLHLFPYADKYM